MNDVALPYPACYTHETPYWTGHYSIGAVTYRPWPTSWLRLRRIPCFSVRLNQDFPLCLHSTDGNIYRPAMHMTSDGGSVPITIQSLPLPGVSLQRDVWPRSFILHDSGCDDGGLWVWVDNNWVFRLLPRWKIDFLLSEGLQAEGANDAEVALIYGGVSLYRVIVLKQ